MNIAKKFDFKVTDGKVTITNYRGIDTEVVIPAEIDGKPVTSIGFAAFSYCTSLTSVKIPNSVVKIGDWTFFDCTSLMNVEISNSMTWIGFGVFYNCISLTSVAISDSVTSIGNRAFEYCRSLTSVTIPNSVTTIGYSAFDSCTSLTSVTIPNSVTTIKERAFGYYQDDEGCAKTDAFTIYGYKGTESKRYAQVNGFKFVDVSDISTTEKKILNKRKELE